MVIGKSEYYKIVKSLGQLTVCGITVNEVPSAEFGMKITKIDENNAYGTHKFYQIELFTSGIFKDLVFSNNAISFLIKSNTDYYSTYQEFKHELHLKVCDQYGNISEIYLCNEISNENANGDVLLEILYVLTLFSEVNDIPLFRNLCCMLFAKNRTLSLDDSIDTIKKFNGIINPVIEKYPFMKDVLMPRMEKNINNIKTKLYEAAIIDKE